MPNKKYIINSGDRFGRLTVIDEVYITKKGYKQRYANCICDCGNKSTMRTTSLFVNTQSCGCQSEQESSSRFFKHGMCKTPLYYVLNSMKNRCYRKELPVYKNYGARGIIICEEWMHNFMSFYNWAIINGYKKGLTIERKDNNKGYSPDNCEFVNRQIQCNNKRDNHIIEYNGDRLTMMNFCRKHDINYSTFQSRVNRGKLIKDAMINCRKYKYIDQRKKVLL